MFISVSRLRCLQYGGETDVKPSFTFHICIQMFLVLVLVYASWLRSYSTNILLILHIYSLLVLLLIAGLGLMNKGS